MPGVTPLRLSYSITPHTPTPASVYRLLIAKMTEEWNMMLGDPQNDLLMAVNEVVGNVLKHSGGLVVKVNAVYNPRARVCAVAVLDQGSGYEAVPLVPVGELQENGRGRAIIAACADRVILSKPRGWFAVTVTKRMRP